MKCPICEKGPYRFDRLLTHVQLHGKVLECPDCGKAFVLRPAGSGRRPRYQCVDYPLCRASHGATDEGYPIGIPGDRETRRLRVRAHKVFDELWKNGPRTRPEAYAYLRDLMGGIPRHEGHISMFDAAKCRELIEKIRAGRGSGVTGGASASAEVCEREPRFGATLSERLLE